MITCSEQAKTKTGKIKIIMKAESKFLNMKDLSFEKKTEMCEITKPGLNPPC